MTTTPDAGDIDAATQRVRELSEQVVAQAKKNGLAWIEGYERMLKNMLDLEEQAAKGTGSVYSFAVVRQPLEKPFAALLPYVVVIVELAEKVRILSHLVDADPESVSCGMAVRVDFATTPAGVLAPVFRPT